MAKTNAQVALEAASRIYAEKGSNVGSHTVTSVADAFYNWLEQKS